jgi:hypothetical protein
VTRNRVVNASPLILLGKLNHIGWLEILSNELVVPQPVAAELRAGATTDAARVWIESAGSKYLRPEEQIDTIISAWDPGAGESAVLT